MSGINKAILLVAGLALAACSDARWDDTNAVIWMDRQEG